ncbi:hypothetical protein NUM3379_11980 [Kineococcus sp. NUM-3379]
MPARERTLVVCAAFDAGLDAAVADLLERLRRTGTRVPAAPRHRPHLTLLGLPCPAAATQDVLAAAEEVAAALPPVPVALDVAGTFGGGAVLWAGPSQAAGLAAWHGEVLARAAAQGLRNTLATARPGRWAPHCTLARRVRDVPAAVRAVEAGLPLAGRVEALAVLEVGGAGDLAHVRLGG